MSTIVALDAKSHYDAMTIAGQLDPQLCRVKVGKELFTHEGSSIVKALHGEGFEALCRSKISRYSKYDCASGMCCCRYGCSDGKCPCFRWP